MFNINHYKELIRRLLNAGLRPTTSWNKEMNVDSLLLRHDIDFSVDYAYQIAKLESKLKINSTFFFMLTSNMYNFLSKHNQKLVREIANMDHKVSLHFDPKVYQSLDSFLHEKSIFENIINKEVDIVSIHQPGIFLNDNNLSLLGTAQTYQDIFFKKMKYISDSGGRDISPLIDEYLKEPRKLGLHLLIHPIWWVANGDSPTKKLNTWRTEYSNFIISEISRNCKTYNEK